MSADNGATVEYTPYGLVRTSSGSLPTDRQFQGQQNQAGVGLYHMGARWYDPRIGLWTQPEQRAFALAYIGQLSEKEIKEHPGTPLRWQFNAVPSDLAARMDQIRRRFPRVSYVRVEMRPRL